MGNFLASLLRFLFQFDFFRKKYFGIHSRFIAPSHLFSNVHKKVRYRNDIQFHLDLEDWIQQQIYFLGDYERQEIDFLYQTLEKNDVFIDVGANIGLFSLNASKIIGDFGKVFAFEAFAPNYDKLKKNIEINGFNNVVAEHLAVSDQDSYLDIFYHNKSNNYGMASAYTKNYDVKDRVKTISLDHYIYENQIENVKLIKIDIEGGEYQALLGVLNLLNQQKPKVMIEINTVALSNSGHSERDILTFFERIQYEKTKVFSQNENTYNALFEASK